MSPHRARGGGRRIWNPTFALAAAVQALAGAVFFILMVGTAGYAQDRFGASLLVAGLAAGVFLAGVMAARLLAGPLVDGLGASRVAAASAVAFAVACPLYLLADDLRTLVVLRLVHGATMGLLHTAVTSVAMGTAPELRRGEATGHLMIAGTLATAAGPLAAGWLVALHGSAAQFWLTTALAGLGAVLAVPLAVRVGRPSWARRPVRTVPWDPTVLRTSASMLLVGVAFSAVLTYVVSLATERDQAAAGAWFFTAYSGAILASRVAAGRHQDRHGADAVVYPGLIAFAGGLLLLATVDSAVALLVAAALVGLGVGTLTSAGQVVAVRRAAPGGMGRAVATHFLLLDLGTAGGPLLLGPLLGVLGYRGMYLVAAGLVVLSAGVHLATAGARGAGAGPRRIAGGSALEPQAAGAVAPGRLRPPAGQP